MSIEEVFRFAMSHYTLQEYFKLLTMAIKVLYCSVDFLNFLLDVFLKIFCEAKLSGKGIEAMKSFLFLFSLLLTKNCRQLNVLKYGLVWSQH